MTEPVRTRFAPSPTGDLHVGNVRSALYNWAFARHNGGAFVLRIEDTDAARSTEESSRGVVEQMSWLGLDWDEGPGVGGPYAPYVQTGRLELYRDVVARLREAGYAYDSYSTDDEVKARRAARGDKTQGYDNYDRELTDAQVSAFRAEGRTPVVRFRMPDEPIVFEDMVRGEVRFEPGNVPDYVLARADGSPLYPLTNPVDDAVMGLRRAPGQERYLGSMASHFEDAEADRRAVPHPWAVHDAATGELVGFAMISDNIPEPMDEDLVGPYYLWRLLIDEAFQGRGYGAATIDAIVAYLRTRPNADVLYTSCVDGSRSSPRSTWVMSMTASSTGLTSG